MGILISGIGSSIMLGTFGVSVGYKTSLLSARDNVKFCYYGLYHVFPFYSLLSRVPFSIST